jgi:hypothetical protein
VKIGLSSYEMNTDCRLFQNSVLRIYDPSSVKETEGGEYNERFHRLCSPVNIIGVIKSSKITYTGHAEHTRWMINSQKILVITTHRI